MLRKSTQSNHQLLRFLHECHRFGQQIREKAHFGTCLHLLLYDEWQAALSEMLPWLHPWPGRAAPGKLQWSSHDPAGGHRQGQGTISRMASISGLLLRTCTACAIHSKIVMMKTSPSRIKSILSPADGLSAAISTRDITWLCPWRWSLLDFADSVTEHAGTYQCLQFYTLWLVIVALKHKADTQE